MTFKPAIWRPIAIVLSAVNLVAVGFAAGDAEPWHAGIHSALALAFGLWAQRLHRVPEGGVGGISSELQAGFEALELEMGQMRQELTEAQERLDFAERLLAQRPEPGRVGPER
jgi:hypothetical protein